MEHTDITKEIALKLEQLELELKRIKSWRKEVDYVINEDE